MAFLNSNVPFGGSINDLQNSWVQQYMNTQYMQNAKSNVLDEINKEVSSLNSDQQTLLSQLQEYQMAKQAYEAGFMAFIGAKFGQEYAQSPDGKVAADNLLSTIKKSKAKIESQLKAKEEKVNTLLELMESDPEMKKRFDELLVNKISKNE